MKAETYFPGVKLIPFSLLFEIKSNSSVDAIVIDLMDIKSIGEDKARAMLINLLDINTNYLFIVKIYSGTINSKPIVFPNEFATENYNADGAVEFLVKSRHILNGYKKKYPFCKMVTKHKKLAGHQHVHFYIENRKADVDRIIANTRKMIRFDQEPVNSLKN